LNNFSQNFDSKNNTFQLNERKKKLVSMIAVKQYFICKQQNVFQKKNGNSIHCLFYFYVCDFKTKYFPDTLIMKAHTAKPVFSVKPLWLKLCMDPGERDCCHFLLHTKTRVFFVFYSLSSSQHPPITFWNLNCISNNRIRI
jgi:hypothetical protein